MAANPDDVPTLYELQRQRQGGWLWVHCQNIRCMHCAPMVIAPLVIRWGDVSSDVLRHNARCSRCGTKGAALQVQSWADSVVTREPFPVD